MDRAYFSYGGITKQPERGSAGQTSGIASKWIHPEFGQAIGNYSGKPVVDREPIISMTPGKARTTSYHGALGRIDSAVKIIEPEGNLSKAPRLPNQDLTDSMMRKNMMMINMQKRFIEAEMSGNDEDMRRILSNASMM